MTFLKESIFVQSVRRMTANLRAGKNVILWIWGTSALRKHPLLGSENVASISRWDGEKEVRYVPGAATNPANLTNLARNTYYLIDAKKPFQLSGAVLILSSEQLPTAPTPTPAPIPAPKPAPTPTPTPITGQGLPTQAELDINLQQFLTPYITIDSV